jgi:hypothetical protein
VEKVPIDKDALEILFLLGLGKAGLVPLTLRPSALVRGDKLPAFRDPAALHGEIMVHGFLLERVKRPGSPPHAFEDVLARQDAHGERMQGLPFQILASRHAELLQLPVKVFGRNPSEGDSQHLFRRDLFFEQPRHPALHRVRFPRPRSCNNPDAVLSGSGDLERHAGLIQPLIPSHA